MRKLYKLNYETIVLDDKPNKFLNPENIYIPIDDFSFFEEMEYIDKNRVILETKDINYLSSISGNFSEIKKKTINGKMYDSLVVNNDFKENEIKYKVTKIKTVNQLLSLLNKNSLYNKLNKKNVDNIIINGVEDEPYIYTEHYILKENSDDIYDTLEILNNIYNSKKNYITLKDSDKENINKYLSQAGSYPNINITVLENLYLIGRDDFLLEKLNFNIENTIVLKPSEVLEIRSYIKNSVSKGEKYISLVNLINKDIKVIYLKKYTSVIDIINKYYPKIDNCRYIKNGLMSGNAIDITTEVLDDSFSAIIILPLEDDSNHDCINCGKCSKVCPVKGNAKKTMITGKFNENCIDCSLCSYYCPAKINLRKYNKGEKDE